MLKTNSALVWYHEIAAELLAEEVGADALLILTEVEKVAIRFGKPDQENLSHLNLAQAAQYVREGQFGVGSMLPKVEAAMKFVRANPDKRGHHHQSGPLSGCSGWKDRNRTDLCLRTTENSRTAQAVREFWHMETRSCETSAVDVFGYLSGGGGLGNSQLLGNPTVVPQRRYASRIISPS